MRHAAIASTGVYVPEILVPALEELETAYARKVEQIGPEIMRQFETKNYKQE